MKVSKRRASLADRTFAGSKPFTSPAICELKAAGSNRVMRVMPDFPASMVLQASGTPLPTGEMTPRPVTTTLRLDNGAPGRDGNQDFEWALM
jgi:hypothetical protein